MSSMPEELLPGLWLFRDRCNVYVVCRGERAIAIDFGSGQWLAGLPAIGVSRLDHVYLTHHHADQCYGLSTCPERPFTVHAPAGEELFLDPAVRLSRTTSSGVGRGCPDSYQAPILPIHGLNFDIVGFSDLYWGDERIRFLHTPGHGANACSVVLDHCGRQIVFCGDAVHTGGTIWRPYNLEWDHWTGSGTLAAWEGVRRLSGTTTDMLCPSHGPVITNGCDDVLSLLDHRLMAFYHAKGAISPGEKDEYADVRFLPCGAKLILPGLYQFGSNGYLLISQSGEALAIDPFDNDMPVLDKLLDYLGEIRITAATVSHYHYDHCNGIPYLRQRYGCKIWLHPSVAEPLQSVGAVALPWLPAENILADILWPDGEMRRWHEFELQTAHWPGQTWWHCAVMTTVAGKKVLFGGDNFQPSSRWNGTGGFCAYNNSRLDEGFSASAAAVLEWSPDLILAGHGTCYRFMPGKFHKAMEWAAAACTALADICPTGDPEGDYYTVAGRPLDGKDIEGMFLWAAD